MTEFLVNVKWNSEKFTSVGVNTEDPPLLFKAQLFSLTGVEPDNQKVIIAGKPLKDDDWSGVKLRNKMTIMMIGTRGDDIPVEPAERPKFIEDMPDASSTGVPSGLQNLGNTCYLNSTLQCFRAVPELKDAIQSYQSSQGNDTSGAIVKGLNTVFTSLSKNDEAGGSMYTPAPFVMLFKAAFPQFAETGDHGEPLQQDAEECWSQLMKAMADTVPGINGSSQSFIDQHFRGQYTTTTHTLEAPDEKPTSSTSSFTIQKCHISNDVNLMHQGIKLSLKGTLEKKSPTLDRNCIYETDAKYSRLPAYLCVEFVRFFWKQDKGKKVKVVRNVKFPASTDLYEFCSDELKAKLNVMRLKMKEIADTKATKKIEDMEVDQGAPKYLPYSFPDDPGSNNSGKYELKAVLTHKGMSADGGHYVAWVKDEKTEGQWILYDDDKVSYTKEEEVLKLSGGGEFHSAYLLLFGPTLTEEL